MGVSEVTWELTEVTPTSRDLPQLLTGLPGRIQYPSWRLKTPIIRLSEGQALP